MRDIFYMDICSRILTVSIFHERASYPFRLSGVKFIAKKMSLIKTNARYPTSYWTTQHYLAQIMGEISKSSCSDLYIT